MAFKLCAACGCSIGKIRTNNEDNFFFDGKIMPESNSGLKKPVTAETELKSFISFGVFDGMGGEDFGETASFTAAHTYKQEAKLLEDYVIPEKQFLRAACEKMNLAVFEAAQKLGTAYMGTTAVLALFGPRQVYVCNLGDSRAYRLRGGEFMQLSKDDTDLAAMLERGIVDHKPRLTQNLGIDPEELLLEPHISKGELRKGDVYLLCSDGLTDMLDNFEICDHLMKALDPEQAVNALMRAALEKGGRDNITLIICRVEE
ncbi:MAG: serine/threonine-protein phosphatase [Oscillospiraceae bacterium]|nr:serine/threonine-protein phosphatase [Oscillospiraceae bacterium]